MIVIPVLDVRRGRAVRALAGDRHSYRPLRSVLGAGSDPVELARACRETLGLRALYLADLDSLADGSPPALGLYRTLADLGLATWIDSGVRDSGDLEALFGAGVGVAVVGLETVRGPDELAAIVEEAGPDRVAFSLDVREGRPLVPTLGAWGTEDPERLADRAIASGVRKLIHLDLARVGTGRGAARLDLAPRAGVERIVGGGISGPEDLDDLAGRGVAAALVGSAIHSGRVGPGDFGPEGWISGRRTS